MIKNRRSHGHFIFWILLTFACLVGFQNCTVNFGDRSASADQGESVTPGPLPSPSPTVAPAQACAEQTFSNGCTASSTASGDLSGSCGGGTGSCSYHCVDGAWTEISNSCEAVTAGTQIITSSTSFTVPPYNTLTVQVWGGGGGGGAAIRDVEVDPDGSAGGTSTFYSVYASGGAGGISMTLGGAGGAGGAGGSGSGGSTNGTGGAGGGPSGVTGGAGGNGAGGGGAGGPAVANGYICAPGSGGSGPGGGGSGGSYNGGGAGGGGGGGYATITYKAGQLTVGQVIPVSVGVAGAGGPDSIYGCPGGAGTPGQVIVTWN